MKIGNFAQIAEVKKAREHKFRVRNKRLRGDLRKNLFTQMVVGIWNILSM